MKKIIIKNEHSVAYQLYIGISAIDGGWMMETGGNPVCLTACEDADDEATPAIVDSLIADPGTAWEELDEEDVEYIADTLEAWGIR